MCGKSSARTRILALLDLLEKETDEAHPLSAEELCHALNRCGYTAARKTLYRDISALKEYGVDILYTRAKPAGFFIAGRSFELPEVRLLTDAVQAAPFITEKKTAELLQKLRGLLGRHLSDHFGSIYQVNRIKFDNEEIYYAIDGIDRAIARGQKLSFTYYHRMISGDRAVPDGGRTFIVSPYALLWDSDKYYLVGNYEKYDDVSVFRVDRMKKVEPVREHARSFEEVSDYRGFFDAADFARRTFRMYHGERHTVELLCRNDILETVLDKFGEDLRFTGKTRDAFRVRLCVYVSDGFQEWLLQYGNRIKVLSPESLKKELERRILEMNRLYGITLKAHD